MTVAEKAALASGVTAEKVIAYDALTGDTGTVAELQKAIDGLNGEDGTITTINTTVTELQTVVGDETAGLVAEHFRGRHCPILFTEPGATLINRYIDFVSKVISIKEIRGKTFVELNCSKHNLGEICELKKLPITVIPQGGQQQRIEDAELVGYTCLEHDVVYRGFTGDLAVGDIIVFGNVGGYTLVSKPPFIRPQCQMVTDTGIVIKKKETFDEVFGTYA